MDIKSLKLITISGAIKSDTAQIFIVVEFPDDTTQKHTALVGKKGIFSYFLNPDHEFVVGTYLVKIYSNNNSKQRLIDTGAFNIYSSNMSFDFEIQRGSSTKSCNGCISPNIATVYTGSTITMHNADSAIHDIQYVKSKKFVGVLKPGESKSINVNSSGKKDYLCTIHPWVYGTITVIKNSFDFPVTDPKKIASNQDKDSKVDGIVEKLPEKTSNVPSNVMPCKSCFGGIVTKVVDGNTIDIDNKRIRLALVNTPERGEFEYREAINFVRNMCPLNSVAWYNIDKGQPIGPFGSTNAEVFCGGTSLNQQLVEQNYGVIHVRYCDTSQFAGSEWAVKKCMGDIPNNAITDNLDETIDDTDNGVEGIAVDVSDSILKNLFSPISVNYDSNIFDPDSYSITLTQIIAFVCIVIVVVIILRIQIRRRQENSKLVVYNQGNNKSAIPNQKSSNPVVPSNVNNKPAIPNQKSSNPVRSYPRPKILSSEERNREEREKQESEEREKQESEEREKQESEERERFVNAYSFLERAEKKFNDHDFDGTIVESYKALEAILYELLADEIDKAKIKRRGKPISVSAKLTMLKKNTLSYPHLQTHIWKLRSTIVRAKNSTGHADDNLKQVPPKTISLNQAKAALTLIKEFLDKAKNST